MTRDATDLHVVFSPSTAASLRQAITAPVICPYDDLSFGPIASDDPADRARWAEEELGLADWREIVEGDQRILAATKAYEGRIVAWYAPNVASSVCGFLWWLSHLAGRPCHIVRAPDLFLLNPGLLAGRLEAAAPLAEGERNRLLERWSRLHGDDAPFRILDGPDLHSAPMTVFDAALMRHVTPVWRKMARIIGDTLSEHADRGFHQTGDYVLGARLATLAEAGRLEWCGDLAQMRFCELRLPQVAEQTPKVHGTIAKP